MCLRNFVFRFRLLLFGWFKSHLLILWIFFIHNTYSLSAGFYLAQWWGTFSHLTSCLRFSATSLWPVIVHPVTRCNKPTSRKNTDIALLPSFIFSSNIIVETNKFIYHSLVQSEMLNGWKVVNSLEIPWSTKSPCIRGYIHPCHFFIELNLYSSAFSCHLFFNHNY